MEEEEGGLRLSKRFGDSKGGGGEVDLKTKAGTAWSHSYLNQKPWHPLSYPNQRRKWIAEQSYAQKQRRAEEVAREYAQEQEFFRQTAMVSKKEKEKMEMMKAVSFMYVRPPGYNAESAKAAEVADEQKKQERDESNPSVGGASSSKKLEPNGEEKKKPRPKDVFGRPLATEEQFEVLKNAPRLETGVLGRAKPFGVEIRNVKCVRCGNFGHQSGDRECPLKDVIMPNEESRLKRDDPLTAILAQTDGGEPLKWELKQKPGLSPPHGGFNPDDPNQQIVAEEIFDEYGGFLSGDVPDLLANLSSSKPKRKSSKSKHKRRLSPITAVSGDREGGHGSSSEDERIRRSNKGHRRKARKHSESIASKSDYHKLHKKSSRHRHSRSSSSDHSDSDEQHSRKHRSHRKHKQSRSSSSDHSDYVEQHRRKHFSHRKQMQSRSSSSDHSESDEQHRLKHRSHLKPVQSRSSSSDHSDSDRQHRGKRHRHHHRRHHHKQSDSSSE